MRWLGLVVALSACGRVDFDPSGDNLPSFFVSPTGRDQGAGTRDDPWGTLPFSIGQLGPGDRLTLLDGEYDTHSVGLLQIYCKTSATTCDGHPCANGTTAAPITIRADHERRAHVFNAIEVLEMDSCHDWIVDGLYVSGIDQQTNPNGQVVHILSSQDIALRHLLVEHANRYENNHLFEIGGSTRITVEDSELYDFFRSGLTVYHSSFVAARRVYANGRNAPDIAGGWVSNCSPGGDHGWRSYYAADSTVDGFVAEGVCQNGFQITAGTDDTGDRNYGDNHYVHDAIAIAVGGGDEAFDVTSDCKTAGSCVSPDHFAANNTFDNVVAIGFPTGINLEGVSSHVKRATVLGGLFGVRIGVSAPAGMLPASAFVETTLVVNADTGVASQDQVDWGVQNTNVFNALTPFSPNDMHVSGTLTVDPQLGACTAYLPPTSPMVALGIGADIRSLWDPQTGRFPCGAVVPGVNDDPATSCIGVHTRLGIGAGCAPP